MVQNAVVQIYILIQEMIEGEEVKDNTTLAKIKTVDEMIPKPAKKDQRAIGVGAWIGEEQYRIIEEYLMMDATIEEACMAAGISMASYYHHKNTNPSFERRMAIAKEFPKVAARAAVMKRIRLGDARTALEYLKLRDRKRYTTDPSVSEEGEKENAPVVQFISVASDEGADQSKSDTQNDIKQSSVYDTSSSSSEAEKMTPWENEEQALRNIDYMSSNNE